MRAHPRSALSLFQNQLRREKILRHGAGLHPLTGSHRRTVLSTDVPLQLLLFIIIIIIGYSQLATRSRFILGPTAHWGNPSHRSFCPLSVSLPQNHPSLLEFSIGVTVHQQRYGPAQTPDFSTNGSHLLYLFCGMSDLSPRHVHVHPPAPQLSQLLFTLGRYP
jgi:hypothetical protein